MQGRKTVPHFFLGADSVPGFGLAGAAATATVGFGATGAGLAALEAAFVPTCFDATGPGVTTGVLAAALVCGAAIGVA